MKTKTLRELARNAKFIPGIYNYCDRWCERCPLSDRCLNYAMQAARDDDDPFGPDMPNEEFPDRLRGDFRQMIEMLRDEAKGHGIVLDDPQLRVQVMAQERAERRLAAKNRSLARAARVYMNAVDKWFDGAQRLFEAKGRELDTLARLEVGDPGAEAAKFEEFVDIIRWYQHFIYAKLRRAIESRAHEDLEACEELQAKDSDGSAKIALIAMDRSIAAWSGLRTMLDDETDCILDLLAQLTAVRRETQKVFPHARAFVRPGFDSIAQARRGGSAV